jgi:hypothetical protein
MTFVSTLAGSHEIIILESNRFKIEADPIVSNRKSDQINDVSGKLYSKDIFRRG